MWLKRFAVSAAVLLLYCSSLNRAQEAGRWQADPRAVERSTRERPGFNFEEARVQTYTLPDLMGASQTKRAWGQRRRKILELFRAHVYGRSPGRPEHLRFRVVEENPQAMGGAATLKRVAVDYGRAGRRHGFELIVFLPNAQTKPAPLFLFLNNRSPRNTDFTRAERLGFWPAEEVIARGYAVAALQVSQLAPDDKEHFRDGVIGLYDAGQTKTRAGYSWGALAAWAWGASRAMDYFVSDPRVDAKRVAVVGHSRGGKAALWAGAEDERFALVISNESGEGGAALSRRRFGETVGQINRTFPHWFAEAYKRYDARVNALPTDQHMLLALIAPRALYVASADEDLWSDPRGEFLSLAYSSPAYVLWGDPPILAEEMPPLDRPLLRARRGYHIRAGGHDLTRYDWEQFLNFADKLWRRF
jgi:dienelactone hydrolase